MVCWVEGDKIELGDNVFISYSCYLDDFAKIKISCGTSIGPLCRIITGNHNLETMKMIGKPVTIGKFCWLGVNVTILPGVKIGYF